jgi:hypothetical protein
MAGLRSPPADVPRNQLDFLSSRSLRSGCFSRWARTPAATVRIGASSAISNNSLATIATPHAKHGKPQDPVRYCAACASRMRPGEICSSGGVWRVKIFCRTTLRQMLDSGGVPAHATHAAPTGGSASAAAPVRPTSCGDGHGTTGADCRQDRRGTRSGCGVAVFHERHGRERPLGPHQSGKAPFWPLPTVIGGCVPPPYSV